MSRQTHTSVTTHSGPFARRVEHPYRVQRMEDLPPALQESAAQVALAPDDPIQSIFVVPAQTLPKKFGGLGGVHGVPAQALIFTAGGVLHIQENASPMGVVHLRGENLLYAHLGMVLLYGRLELCSAGDNTLQRIILEYNTVSQPLLQPALHQFLRLSRPPLRPVQDGMQTRLLDELGSLSFKFNNGLQNYVLQPGDGLLGYVFQPAIMRRYARLFQRTVAPPTLLALTQSQIAIIEEGMTSATRYGWYITYCPRGCVTGFESRPDAAWQDVNLRLSRNNLEAVRRVRLNTTAAGNWQALWARYAE